MISPERLRAELGSVILGPGGAVGSADRLCNACVDLLEVDGAAISLMREGAMHGTFGSSGELSRRLDELQFTFGEGPCLEAVRQCRQVLVDDLSDPRERRWPAFTEALLGSGVRAVAALPVTVAASPIGALDLFWHSTGSFGGDTMNEAQWVAELAALPLLGLIGERRRRSGGRR